ncbi:MAG: periplasmic heavy metal sensor [Nitrospirota bacterium]|nr:periplasmic heavy metal sensor [Nitrospirota bacterium]
MKRNVLILMGAFVVASLLFTGMVPGTASMFSGAAQAAWGADNGHDDHGDGGGGGNMAEMMGALGLDDAQWKKFNELRRKYRRDTIQIQARIDVAEVDLEDMADSNPPDMKKIEIKIREISNLQAELRVYRYRALADMRGFITAEQFDTFRWMAMKMGFNFSEGGKGHGH